MIFKNVKCLPSSQAQEENINWLQQNSEEECFFLNFKMLHHHKVQIKSRNLLQHRKFLFYVKEVLLSRLLCLSSS